MKPQYFAVHKFCQIAGLSLIVMSPTLWAQSISTLINTSDPGGVNQTAFLLQRLEQLQTEIMNLNGLLEEQTHRLDQLEQENRQRYTEIDERLLKAVKPNSINHVPVPPPTTPLENISEKQQYQNALSHIRTKQYGKARVQLAEFIRQHPSTELTANAYYWLGEVEMAQGEILAAQKAFAAVAQKFPKSNKVPDAQYKLAVTFEKLGDVKKAQQLFEQVIRMYPNTTASGLADTQLRSMVD